MYSSVQKKKKKKKALQTKAEILHLGKNMLFSYSSKQI